MGSRERWGVHLTLEKAKSLRFFKVEKFQKNFKKNERIIIFRRFLRKLCDFMKIFKNFIEILGKNFGKFGYMDLVGVR